MRTAIARSLAFGLIVFSLLSPLSTNAQSANLNKFGVTVSPVTDEFSIKPGEIVKRTVKVTNPVRDVLTLYPVKLNFTTDNDKGQPKFYTLAERSTPYAISDWMAFDKPFIRIAPDQVEEFTYTVTAPADAEAGGHYGAVLFSTEPPKTDPTQTQVSVVGLVGTLVLATVPGDIHQTTAIQEFDAPTVLVKGPALLSLLFSNSGNVHTKPQGEIKIRNWSGSLVKAIEVNPGDGNVLPGSQRRFNYNWQFDWTRFGKYSATAVISYGNPQQQLTAVRNFFVVPIWLLIIIGLILLAFIYWLFVRPVLKRRQGNQPPLRPTRTMPKTPPSSPTQPESRPPKIVMR